MSGSEGEHAAVRGCASGAASDSRRLSYDAFRHLVERECKPDDRVLVVGCGNSRMSEGKYYARRRARCERLVGKFYARRRTRCERPLHMHSP